MNLAEAITKIDSVTSDPWEFYYRIQRTERATYSQGKVPYKGTDYVLVYYFSRMRDGYSTPIYGPPSLSGISNIGPSHLYVYNTGIILNPNSFTDGELEHVKYAVNRLWHRWQSSYIQLVNPAFEAGWPKVDRLIRQYNRRRAGDQGKVRAERALFRRAVSLARVLGKRRDFDVSEENLQVLWSALQQPEFLKVLAAEKFTLEELLTAGGIARIKKVHRQ